MKTKSITLKTIIAITVAAMTFALVPQSADAGHSDRRYSHKCGSCGHSVYAYPSFVGYNSCGQRVYRYVPRRHSNCGHRSHYRGHTHRSSKADAVASIVRGIIELKQSQHRHRGW